MWKNQSSHRFSLAFRAPCATDPLIVFMQIKYIYVFRERGELLKAQTHFLLIRDN